VLGLETAMGVGDDAMIKSPSNERTSATRTHSLLRFREKPEHQPRPRTCGFRLTLKPHLVALGQLG
jgi:hypothetical protein